MPFWVTVRKLNVTDRRTDRRTDGQTDGQTDRQTDGGRCNISRPGPSAPWEIITNQFLRKCSKVQKGHKFPISTLFNISIIQKKHEEKIKWEIIVSYSQIFVSRNVGNSIKCEKNITPPAQTTPTFEIQNQNKGIEDIMDIDSNCPYLLFGETTSHLTSKLNVMDGRTDGGFNIFF